MKSWKLYGSSNELNLNSGFSDCKTCTNTYCSLGPLFFFCASRPPPPHARPPGGGGGPPPAAMQPPPPNWRRGGGGGGLFYLPWLLLSYDGSRRSQTGSFLFSCFSCVGGGGGGGWGGGGGGCFCLLGGGGGGGGGEGGGGGVLCCVGQGVGARGGSVGDDWCNDPVVWVVGRRVAPREAREAGGGGGGGGGQGGGTGPGMNTQEGGRGGEVARRVVESGPGGLVRKARRGGGGGRGPASGGARGSRWRLLCVCRAPRKAERESGKPRERRAFGRVRRGGSVATGVEGGRCVERSEGASGSARMDAGGREVRGGGRREVR